MQSTKDGTERVQAGELYVASKSRIEALGEGVQPRGGEVEAFVDTAILACGIKRGKERG
jgi:hypothetical protein